MSPSLRTLALLSTLLSPACLWITPKQHDERTDLDNDGFPADVDCDNTDPKVFPGAEELSCDEKDNDCDAATPDGPVWLSKASGSRVYGSIAEALIAAEGGSTVTLCPGNFSESVVILQSGLTLAGSGADRTTIDGFYEANLPVIEVQSDDVTIRDLTVKGGEGCERIIDGVPLTHGGGICAFDALGTLTIEGVRVTDNVANKGGGIAGPFVPDAVLSLGPGTSVDLNAAGSGGGLYLFWGAELSGVTIAENTASLDGGGINIERGVLSLGDSVVRLNSANGNGGGIWTSTDDGASVGGGNIEENNARGGGGIYGAKILEGVAVRRNHAFEGGGGFATGTPAEEPETFVIRGASLFEGNTSDGEGGAISVQNIPLEISDGGGNRPKFSDNNAKRGGAIWSFGQLDIVGADFTGNAANGQQPTDETDEPLDYGGAAIWAESGGVSITDTTISGSRCDGCGAIGTREASFCLDTVTFSENASAALECGEVEQTDPPAPVGGTCDESGFVEGVCSPS